MRPLYSILESIADSDEEVLAKQFIEVTLPTYIAEIYHKVFGEVVENDSKVIKIDKWFTLGYVDEDHIMIEDFRGTCKNMKRWAKQFETEIKHRDKGIRVKSEYETNKFQDTVTWSTVTWKVTITISYDKTDYKIAIIVEGDDDNDTKIGMVWTTSDKLSQLL